MYAYICYLCVESPIAYFSYRLVPGGISLVVNLDAKFKEEKTIVANLCRTTEVEQLTEVLIFIISKIILSHCHAKKDKDVASLT